MKLRMMSSSSEGLEQLETMIRRDRNHPSVIIWSIGNEEDLQGSDTGARIAKSMKRLVRQFDSTRPVTEAMNDDWGKGLSAVVDVQGFNYHSAEQMDAFHRQSPKQPTIGTETASTVCTRGIYQNDQQAGYVSAYDLNIPPWAQLAENWWSVYAERPWVAGDLPGPALIIAASPRRTSGHVSTLISASWIPAASQGQFSLLPGTVERQSSSPSTSALELGWQREARD